MYLTWISVTIILVCFLILFNVFTHTSIRIISQPIPLPYNWTIKYSQTKVLEIGAWRTGSSFLGELISQYPKTFYSYEPLHVLSGRVSLLY